MRRDRAVFVVALRVTPSSTMPAQVSPFTQRRPCSTMPVRASPSGIGFHSPITSYWRITASNWIAVASARETRPISIASG